MLRLTYADLLQTDLLIDVDNSPDSAIMPSNTTSSSAHTVCYPARDLYSAIALDLVFAVLIVSAVFVRYAHQSTLARPIPANHAVSNVTIGLAALLALAWIAVSTESRLTYIAACRHGVPHSVIINDEAQNKVRAPRARAPAPG